MPRCDEKTPLLNILYNDSESQMAEVKPNVNVNKVRNVSLDIKPTHIEENQIFKTVSKLNENFSVESLNSNNDSLNKSKSKAESTNMNKTVTSIYKRNLVKYANEVYRYSVDLSDLKAHGGPWVTVTPDGLKSGEELANYILKQEKSLNKNIPDNEMFLLRSCNSAMGGTVCSNGQVLANKLGRNVKAFKWGYISSHANISNKITVFKPQKNTARIKLTSVLNSICSSLIKPFSVLAVMIQAQRID